MKEKKYSFLLRITNISEIDKKYNLVQQDQLNIPEYSTKIDDLTINEEKYYILDNNKIHYYITMMDSILNKQLIRTNCFWDRHPFDTSPIGCPLKYIPNRASIEYHIPTKDKCIIMQNIPKVFNYDDIDDNVIDIVNRVIDMEDNCKVGGVYDDSKLSECNISHNDYYITDGCFCSFNCCLAFINDNIKNPQYVNSKYLLMKMFIELYNDYNLKIIPSPSWRLLRSYGGHMSIDTFRESINQYRYIESNNVANVPKMLSVGKMYEEEILMY